jgi:DsbC/DsbD-like thiol-disulfide interchange protein
VLSEGGERSSLRLGVAMKQLVPLACIVAAGFGFTSAASADAPAGGVKILSTDAAPESSVNLSFEPLVTGIRPGQRFLLAAHFKMARGYRIGWKGKGDVGRATVVTFRAPAGFDVGPTQFPAPSRFTDGNRGEWLGYESETAIFAEVKAPSTVRPDDVIRLDMFVEYAACRDECRVARSSAFVELEAARGDSRAHEAEAQLAPFRARLPKPGAHLDANWQVTSKDATLVVKMKGATLTDFFSEGGARPAPLDVHADAGALAIRYDEAPGPGTRPLRGVVAARVDSRDAFYEFEVKPKGLGDTREASLSR